MMDTVEPPNQTFAGSVLFMKVTLQSALVLLETYRTVTCHLYLTWKGQLFSKKWDAEYQIKGTRKANTTADSSCAIGSLCGSELTCTHVWETVDLNFKLRKFSDVDFIGH
jgi:hypothetical protein